MKTAGKMKDVKIKSRDKEAEKYDAKMSKLDYPGTKGMALPESGKQKVSGFKFSGTY